MVKVKNGRLKGRGDAFAAEALCCPEALVWLKENNFSRIQVELCSEPKSFPLTHGISDSRL